MDGVVFCYTFASAFGQKIAFRRVFAVCVRSLRDLHGDIRSSTRGSAALAVFSYRASVRALGIDMKPSMTGDVVSGASLA